MSQITTHILDTAKGKPAAGVPVILFMEQNGTWQKITAGITNADGRIADLTGKGRLLDPGDYKMAFETKIYFDNTGVTGFYPMVEIIFTISDAEHYHIPLLLSPFGYTTYRGS
jgi:5-hydroxyisourate hydrolase